jgi:hypothetical protein
MLPLVEDVLGYVSDNALAAVLAARVPFHLQRRNQLESGGADETLLQKIISGKFMRMDFIRKK